MPITGRQVKAQKCWGITLISLLSIVRFISMKCCATSRVGCLSVQTSPPVTIHVQVLNVK